MSSSADTKSLIETAITRFLDEVPALQPLKLTFALELHGRGDVQVYRIQLPGPKIDKDDAPEARVRLSVPRADFNHLATEGKVKSWRKSFELGHAKAEGQEQLLKLIANVVEKQEQRQSLRKAKH